MVSGRAMIVVGVGILALGVLVPIVPTPVLVHGKPDSGAVVCALNARGSISYAAVGVGATLTAGGTYGLTLGRLPSVSPIALNSIAN